MRKLRILLLHKYIIKIVTIIFLICSLIVTNFFPLKSKYDIKDTSFKGIITKIDYDNNKMTIYLKAKEKLIVNYYNYNNKDDNLSLGDKIEVIGNLTIPSNNTIPNIFNYKKYLYYNKIYYLIKAKKIIKIRNNTSVFYYLKKKITNRINNIDKTSDYLNTLLLGNKKIDKNILSTYQSNGISHLFSISGMHISLFLGIIFFILNRVSYNNYYKYCIVIIILLFYMLLVNTISIKRSIIMFIFFSINKLFRLKISNIDIMGLTLIIMLIINPFCIYLISFQYSYLITLTFIILSKKIKQKNKYFSKLLYTSYISFLVSLPITIYNFYEINLLSIFLNLIYVPIVSIIIFPLSILTFIIPLMDSILLFFINIIETISIIANKISITKIVIPKPNIILVFIYYIIIILVLKNKKYIKYLLLLIILHKFSICLNNNLNVIMLDVGQGDSTLLTFPYNKTNILIDTGGNNNYSISKDKIIPYLKSKGITKLNYLILTHGDFDHMGEAVELINNFKVDNVILNIGKYNELELQLIKLLKEKNILYYQNIDSLQIVDNKIYFLNTKDYNDENNNSCVIYMQTNKIKMLFMGDAGIEKEKDIIKKYNINKIDILKVGHHGSSTSSNKKFIDNINPKICLISVGKNNRYNHPNTAVVNLLNDYCNIYRSDIKGSVELKINKTGYNIKNYSS